MAVKIRRVLAAKFLSLDVALGLLFSAGAFERDIETRRDFAGLAGAVYGVDLVDGGNLTVLA